MNNDERHLADQLRRAARDMPEARVDLDAIQHGERLETRRPARAVLLAVAATVVAIALPIAAVVALRHVRTQTPPVATSTSSTSAQSTTGTTLTTSSTPAAEINPIPRATVTFVPSALPQGPPPALAYLVGSPVSLNRSTTSYIHAPNNVGPTIAVRQAPQEHISDFTAFRDGYLVLLQTGAGQTDIRYYSSSGSMVQMAPLRLEWTDALARGGDGSVAVSLTPGQVTLFDASGKASRTWKVPNAQIITPVRVLPDHTVLIVVTNVREGQTKKLRLEPIGSVATWSSPDAQAVDVNPVNGDLSVLTKCFYASRAASVIDPATQQPLWVDCGYHPGYFSPDGRLLAAVASTTKPNGKETLAIIDAATGTVLVRFDPGPANWNWTSVWYVRWEDDTHVLVFAYGGDGLLFRFGVDGSAQVVGVSVPVNGSISLER